MRSKIAQKILDRTPEEPKQEVSEYADKLILSRDSDFCPVCKKSPCESAGKWYPEDDEE
jgi:hypothetical protein